MRPRRLAEPCRLEMPDRLLNRFGEALAGEAKEGRPQHLLGLEAVTVVATPARRCYKAPCHIRRLPNAPPKRSRHH